MSDSHKVGEILAQATHQRLGADSPLSLLPQSLLKDIAVIATPDFVVAVHVHTSGYFVRSVLTIKHPARLKDLIEQLSPIGRRHIFQIMGNHSFVSLEIENGDPETLLSTLFRDTQNAVILIKDK